MSTATLPINAGAPEMPRPAGLRLAPMVALVAAYWVVYASVGMTEIPGFHKFLYRLGALAIMLLGFTGWWLFNRRMPLASRIAVLGVAILSAIIAVALKHPSVHGPLIVGVATYGIAATISGWIAWLVASRDAPAATCRRGMMLVAVIAWAWVVLVRMDGLGGATETVFHWRWTPSGEEKFLAEQAKLKLPSDANKPLAAAVVAATDADWPAFRGDARDSALHGVEIATNWNESPPKQVWKQRVGPGWSSIVVVGDNLYTQEQIGDEEAVACYDAATGKPRWMHKDKARFDEAMGGVGPRATPTFADGRVYALGAAGVLNCLDAATGEPHWSHDIKSDGQEKIPMWGFCSSPLVVDGKVIVFAGGGGAMGGDGKEKKSEEPKAAPAAPVNPDTLLAYDAESGKLAWRAPAGDHSYSSAQLAKFDGQKQILFVGNAALVSVDPADGKVLWSLPGNGPDGAPNIQPHLQGDTDVLASFTADTGLVRAVVSHKDSAWNAEVIWTSKDLKPFFSDFVRVGDALYGFDGSVFCCIDANTGKRQWKQGRNGRYGSGQVLLVADQPVLVVLTEAGEAVLVAANPEKLEELGRFKAIEGKTWNHPTIVGHRLYVRNAEEMACFEL
jgi:outer membrane protein assembly factor BamB